MVFLIWSSLEDFDAVNIFCGRQSDHLSQNLLLEQCCKPVLCSFSVTAAPSRSYCRTSDSTFSATTVTGSAVRTAASRTTTSSSRWSPATRGSSHNVRRPARSSSAQKPWSRSCAPPGRRASRTSSWPSTPSASPERGCRATRVRLLMEDSKESRMRNVMFCVSERFWSVQEWYFVCCEIKICYHWCFTKLFELRSWLLNIFMFINQIYRVLLAHLGCCRFKSR